MKLIIILICFLVGIYVGRHIGHTEIATACEKLGGFYVGQNTYQCVKIAPKEDVSK